MKEIVITNKNGITLPTKNKLVDDDIKIKVSDSIKSIDGVELISGPNSGKDLQIDGSKDFGAIIVDSYNGDLFVTNMLETDQQTNIKVAGYANVKIVDEHPKNLITAENLEPQNIKKDVNILGVTGTLEGAGGNTLKNLLDNTKSARYLFEGYSQNNLSELIQYNDTENVEKFIAMFSGCKAKTLPLFNTSKGNNFIQFLRNCDAETIPAYDLSGGTNFSDSFDLYKITSFLAYGMKVSFYIGRSTLLEAPALVTILSNCQVITSTQTLTMGSTLLAKLEGVYVKETGVEQYEGITCRPCVICESTDAGAMLATDYFTGKGWTLA